MSRMFMAVFFAVILFSSCSGINIPGIGGDEADMPEPKLVEAKTAVGSAMTANACYNMIVGNAPDTKIPLCDKGVLWFPFPTAFYDFGRIIPPDFCRAPGYIVNQYWWYAANPADYIQKRPAIFEVKYESRRTESVAHNGKQLQPNEIPKPLADSSHPCVPDTKPDFIDNYDARVKVLRDHGLIR